MSLDQLVKVREAHQKGLLPQDIYDTITERFDLVTQGIARIEKASGTPYPISYVEPSAILTSGSDMSFQYGILFARTLPVFFEEKFQVVIQISAPLVAFGLKGTIHAILAHEFMHYLELVSRIVRMRVISDEVSGTLFEGRYADAGKLLEERAVFKSDPTLIRHITTRFPEGFRDFKLEDKVIKLWMDKGLATTNVPIDA